MLRHVVGAAVAVVVCGCGSGEDDSFPPQLFAVVSAFPAELAPHLERATVRDTLVIDDRVFRVGMLYGVPVVLALTGIGLANASATTRLLLERFAPSGIVVSAVAGSAQLAIGDVAVPATWAAKDGMTYAADPKWLTLAATIAAGPVSLERCTTVPSVPGQAVCMPQEPVIVVGGAGRSTDPFLGKPFPCRPGGGDVFGCDVLVTAADSVAVRREAMPAAVSADAQVPVVEDMETAAIAREAAARSVPFIAFRAVSDGPGDPLNLPGSLDQFTAYYGLAAHNAAAATAAFLKVLGTP